MTNDPHTIIVDDPLEYSGYMTFLIDYGRFHPEGISICGHNDAEFTVCGMTDGICFNPWCDMCHRRLKADLDELLQYRLNGKTNGGRKTKRIRGLSQ